ncbi:unnamed protein product, partial [marine sediment metagenome]
MINVKNTKREFLELLANVKLKSVLDLGCGKALLSRFFTKKKIKVIGIDKKDLCVDIDNFNFILSDVKQDEFEKERDLIMASLV